MATLLTPPLNPQGPQGQGPGGDASQNETPQTEDQILASAFDPTSKIPPLLPGLTSDLEASLTDLITEFERESYPTWRFLNRDFLEAETFWKDLQTGFYDHRFDVWRVPSVRDVTQYGESGQRFDFATNLYKAWGTTVINTLGQKIPTTRFLPHDYRKESDVITSRAATSVVPLIERNNSVGLLHMRACYLLFTHGICGSYTRYLADGERFGWRDEPEIGMGQVKTQEEGFECPQCFSFFPAAPGPNQQVTPPVPCPNCGYDNPKGFKYVPEQMSPAPQVTGTRKTPKGQEVISIHGGLELRLPPWAIEQTDCVYLGLVNEVHKSQIRQIYGERGKQVQGGYGAGLYDTWDRFARLALLEPTVSYYSTSNQNLVTVKRYWMRPAAFEMVEKKESREKIKAIFPDGAYIVFVEPGKLLDARNEKMDDHWNLCKGQEGPGMYTPPLGLSAISIQKRYNVLHNFVMEWVEYSAAGQGTFVNTNLISYKALASQRKAPGYIYPIKVAGNQSIQNAIYTDRPAQIAGEIFRYAGDLEQIGQNVTGATPTAAGGTEMSLKPTTYLADREQSLGRLYGPWSHLRSFWAGTMLIAVKQFAHNRTEDEFYSVWGLRGEVEGRDVYLIDMQGEVDAYPETNENFPVTWNQMNAMLMKLMESQDPYVQAILGHPDNTAFPMAVFGLPELTIPGQDDRQKQAQEIAQLMQGQPIMQMNPVTGQPQILPSIPIDEFEDNHQVHIDKVKDWAVSPAGLKSKKENAMGYKNVIAHGRMHEEHLSMLAMSAGQVAGAQAGATGVKGKGKAAPAASSKSPSGGKPGGPPAEGGPSGAQEQIATAINEGGEGAGGGEQ